LLALGLCLLSTSAAFARKNPLSFICIEAESGLVIDEQNADIQRPPASMVKLMQLFLVDEGMTARRFRSDQAVVASAFAKSKGGTQVYLDQGESWPLEKMMRAVAIASANDAATAVAESLWGSETAYVKAMNKRALEIGMKKTLFQSAHGLPPRDGKAHDLTTARDMAVLARQCVQRPAILELTARKSASFRAGEKSKDSTNKLLWSLDGCDGLKTGFTHAAGFCLTATAKQDGIRLICVVMGADSKKARFRLAGEILEAGFKQIRRLRPVQAGAFSSPPLPVSNGALALVRLVAENDIWVTVKEKDAKDLIQVAEHPKTLRAPLHGGAAVGEVKILLGDQVVGRTRLLTPYAVERRQNLN
jgi:serine-type D-Ala-D-Ala carboxypeptidase (penicillin-binding protein 5/6)